MSLLAEIEKLGEWRSCGPIEHQRSILLENIETGRIYRLPAHPKISDDRILDEIRQLTTR